MNLPERIIKLLVDYCEKNSRLKVSQDMLKIIYYLSQKIKNEVWIINAQNFIAKLCNEYPTIKYYIDKYNNTITYSNSNVEITINKLSLAGISIYGEVYIEQSKTDYPS